MTKNSPYNEGARNSSSNLTATTFTVKEASTLLPFITQALHGISRSKAKSILTGGGVTVNDKVRLRHDYPLSPGDTVAVSKRKPAPHPDTKYIRIVYEDSHIIVIDKQPGILSMASNHHAFSVKSLLDDYFHRSRQRCTAHVVHRLDRDTSGLLVYAKTLQAEQTLEHNWREIVTDRRYVALVSGQLPQSQGTLSSWLRDNKSFFTISYPSDPGGGKWAVTHYRQLHTDGEHSIVELKLETGRKNQIRVHLQDIGHPVCGDTKYGNGDDPIGRLALHAFRLNFFHPATGQPLTFETPLPHPFIHALRPQR